MHSIGTTLILFFLAPFNWIVLLIIMGFIARAERFKKICFGSAIGLFLVFSNGWLLDWYASNWLPRPVRISSGISYSCGIVPGGFASPDEKGEGYFNSAADRFIEAVELFKKGVITHLLITGGNGKKDQRSFREAAWVKKQMVILGVPDSVIYTEDRSDNTADNAINAKTILDSVHLRSPYLLITSAVHMPRASLLFEKKGISIVDYPCNYDQGKAALSLASFWPSVSALSDWSYYLKETAGYWWVRLK